MWLDQRKHWKLIIFNTSPELHVCKHDHSSLPTLDGCAGSCLTAEELEINDPWSETTVPSVGGTWDDM
eukprot:2986612-Amphidinium_carterae.2